ncbi:hypothetical protein DFH09DRAFT_1090986 [Mycena vulgaris]|nr:hypothetical protein DFH09DRAFT_1090986 [Mycena vulgaris]
MADVKSHSPYHEGLLSPPPPLSAPTTPRPPSSRRQGNARPSARGLSSRRPRRGTSKRAGLLLLAIAFLFWLAFQLKGRRRPYLQVRRVPSLEGVQIPPRREPDHHRDAYATRLWDDCNSTQILVKILLPWMVKKNAPFVPGTIRAQHSLVLLVYVNCWPPGYRDKQLLHP